MVKATPFLLNSRVLIDEEDEEIVRHISKRVNLARKVLKYKKKRGLPLFDRKRERKIKDGMLKFAASCRLKLDRKTVGKIVNFLLKISKEGFN